MRKLSAQCRQCGARSTRRYLRDHDNVCAYCYDRPRELHGAARRAAVEAFLAEHAEFPSAQRWAELNEQAQAWQT